MAILKNIDLNALTDQCQRDEHRIVAMTCEREVNLRVLKSLQKLVKRVRRENGLTKKAQRCPPWGIRCSTALGVSGFIGRSKLLNLVPVEHLLKDGPNCYSASEVADIAKHDGE